MESESDLSRRYYLSDIYRRTIQNSAVTPVLTTSH